jgi:C1A family cysteine protease
LALIDERNKKELAKGGTAVHGITKFADFSQEEIRSRLLNKKVKDSEKFKSDGDKVVKKVARKSDSVTSVDWSNVYTTAVKDQGYCGSCWAFSATEQIESDAIAAGYLTTTETLSPQQIVSCDSVDYGCDGGWTLYAYNYVKSAGGLTSDSAYPYTSYWDVTGSCIVGHDVKYVTVSDFHILKTEDDMINYVLSTGPISVCLDASEWSYYESGVMTSCGDDVDHCVQAVGLDESASYWKVRNSWGTDWGDQGFIYLELGANTCDITYVPTYTSVSLVNSYSGKKNL